MTNMGVIVEVLEIILLVPIFIAFITIFYRAATSFLEVNKVASGMCSVVLSALIMVGMKKHMMVTVLLPCAAGELSSFCYQQVHSLLTISRIKSKNVKTVGADTRQKTIGKAD